MVKATGTASRDTPGGHHRPQLGIDNPDPHRLESKYNPLLQGGAGVSPAERMAAFAIDPYDLIRVMPA